MMKSLFRLFIVYLFVGLFFDSPNVFSAETNTVNPGTNPLSNSAMPFGANFFNLCESAQNNLKDLRANFSNKCGGLVEPDCINEAKKCRSGSEDLGQKPMSLMVNMVQSAMMGGLTGGFPMMGAGGPDAFKCLPVNRLQDVKSRFEKLEKETRDTEKAKNDLLTKLDDKEDEVNKEIKEMKTSFVEKMSNVSKNNTKMPSEERQMKEAAAAKTEALLSEISKRESEIADHIAAIEESETERGSLYLRTMGECAKKLETDKKGAVKEYFTKLDEMHQLMNLKSEITEKEKVKRDFKRNMIPMQKIYEAEFKASFNVCIEAQTIAYNREYKRLTSLVDKSSRNIKQFENEITRKFKEIKDTSAALSEAIQALKTNNETERKSAMAEMAALQESVRTSINTFNTRKTKASQEYQAAHQKLNLAQMQQFTNQSIYHMNTFGDAASLLQSVNDQKKITCATCAGVPGMPPLPYCNGESGTTKESDDGSR